MSHPANASLNELGHRIYRWKKQPFVSVTTVIEDGYPKPSLPYWSAWNVAQYVANNFYDVEAMIKSSEPKKVISTLRAQPTIYKEERAKIGSIVHAGVEDYIRFEQRPFLPTEETNAYMDQFENFLKDWHPQFTHTEFTVYSRRFGYAGTADGRLILDGHPLIYDIKSGKHVYEEAAIQMSAYDKGDFIGVCDDEEPLPNNEGAVVLHLSPEKYELIPVYIGPEVFEQFLRCLDTYRFKYEQLKKLQVLYKPVTQEKLAKLNGTSPDWLKKIWLPNSDEKIV